MALNNKLYSALLVALLTLSAYCLADTIDAVVGRSLSAAPRVTAPAQNKPLIEARRELSDYSSILDRGLFGEGKAPSAAPAQQAEAVNYKLIGTVEGTVFAGAVLEDPSGQAFYRLEQRLSDGSRIVKVLRDRVTLRRQDGSSATLQLSDDTKIVALAKPGDSGGIRRLAGNKFAVDERTVAASTENMSQLLTQARALPYVENGKTVGFRITEIVPGSLYEKIGLQNGDVIQKINSQDVDDPGKFFQLYQGLKDERNISIDVVRGGQRQTFTYDIR